MQIPTRSQLVVLGMFIINLVLTYLSNTGAYGPTNADVSGQFHSMITPPGYAFSIWALIFTWEAIACIAQCLPRFREEAAYPFSTLAIVGWTVTCIGQGVWSIIFAQQKMSAALAVLILCWLGLAATVTSLSKSLRTEWHERSSHVISGVSLRDFGMWMLFVAPFSLHFGWMTIAMCLNGELVAVAECSSLSSQLVLALLTLVFASIMVVVMSIERRNAVYAAAVAWALLSLRDRDTAKPICTAGNGALVLSNELSDALTTTAVTLGSVLLSLSCIRLALVPHFSVGRLLAGETAAKGGEDCNGDTAALC